MNKLYIAVLDDAPDYIVPTLVAHAVLGAHLVFTEAYYKQDECYQYMTWLTDSFRKVVVKVNQKEFDKISALPNTYLGHESTILEGRKSCAIPLPCSDEERPNVLKFAKKWAPKKDMNIEKTTTIDN